MDAESLIRLAKFRAQAEGSKELWTYIEKILDELNLSHEKKQELRREVRALLAQRSEIRGRLRGRGEHMIGRPEPRPQEYQPLRVTPFRKTRIIKPHRSLIRTKG